MRVYTIKLELEVSEEELETRGKDEDTQREEISSIAYQWADALEKECVPRIQRSRVKFSEVRES